MTTPEIKSLAAVVKQAIESRLYDVHTCTPGKIVSIDQSERKVSVQPLLRRKYNDGRIITLPIIYNVPIMDYRSGDAFVILPLAVGDTGALIFNERSIDNWLVTGGFASPDDPRKFDLSDAIFCPGLYPFSSTVSVESDALTIKNGSMKVEVKPNGKIKLENTSNEIVTLLVDLVQAILDARTNTALGPQPLLNPEFSTIKSKLETFKV